MAIMLPKDTARAIQIVHLCFLNMIILTIFFFVLILFGGGYVVSLLKMPTLSKWLLLLPLAAFFLSINNVLIVWFNRNMQYKTISVNKISRSTLLASSMVVLGFSRSSHGGLIVSQVISDGMAACYYLITYFFRDLKRKIIFNIKDLMILAREYKDFPSFMLPTDFMDTFSIQLPIFLITAFFSSEISGSYFFALRILAIPVALIGSAYSQTFFQKFVSYVQAANYQEARKFLYRSWLLLASMIALPAIFLFAWGETLFSFFFGNAWSESGAISSVLIFYIMFSFVSSPTSSTYIALRMQKYSFIFGIAVLTYRFLSFYVGYLMDDFYAALKILVTCEVVEIVVYNSIVLLKLKSLSVER